MAKAREKPVLAQIKLQIPAGKASPAPPVGPALGQHGVAIIDFCQAFNAATTDKGGLIIPVVITVYQDRSFSFNLRVIRPLVASLKMFEVPPAVRWTMMQLECGGLRPKSY